MGRCRFAPGVGFALPGAMALFLCPASAVQKSFMSEPLVTYQSPPPSQTKPETPSRPDAEDFNGLVLRMIARMPQGGRYATSGTATANLRKAIALDESGRLRVNPQVAKPSFCSSATYLVLLMAVEELTRSGKLRLDKSAAGALLYESQPDGAGVWGRWNANGPGTARLFHELGLGRNFTAVDDAKPGDFLKIWWSDEIGAKERGHLVIYLGQRTDADGQRFLKFWSSNQPGGYGEKEVPIEQAKRLLFSRLMSPNALSRAAELPPKDAFLASMLTRRTTFDEVKAETGAR